MKTYKVKLSIGLHAFVNAQHWAHEGEEILFRVEDSIIASYTRNFVLRIAVGDVVEYEQARGVNPSGTADSIHTARDGNAAEA